MRMTLFVLISSSLLFVAFAFFVRYAAGAHFEESDNAELSGKLSLVGGIVDRIASADDLPGAQSTLSTALVGHPGVAIKVIGGDGTVLLSVANPPRRPMHGTSAVRTRSERLWHPVLGEVRIDATLDSAYHHEFLDQLLGILLGAVAVAVPMAAILGWLLAGQALRPIARLTRVATAVTADNLQGRVDTGRVPAELQELARAFDAMLARLRDSFERLADYSVDLAHELRTPLNNVITQAEVALSRARGEDEYREVLYSTLEQCRRLARMIADMLFIARAEKGLLVPEREPVELAAVTRKVVEYFTPLAEDMHVHLVENGAATISGDSLMVERAIANLVSNAVRHAAKWTVVEVEIGPRSDEVAVAVVNRGETIPPEELPRLFERFYRADTGQPRSGAGTGLGLAITKSIMEAHGGRVVAASADGTTRFELRFRPAPAVWPSPQGRAGRRPVRNSPLAQLHKLGRR